MITIKINNKSYKVEEAKSEEERRKGLQGKEELPEDEGMLFYIPDKKSQCVFTMIGMKFPIDIIFINLNEEVVDIKENCLPDEEQIVNSTENLEEDDYIAYVLEVNVNSGIKIGDDLEFEDEDEPPIMKILASDGSTLYELWGGERIISRKETKVLIKKAKRASETNEDKDFKALGKYLFKVFNKQDNREPEYVELPE